MPQSIIQRLSDAELRQIENGSTDLSTDSFLQFAAEAARTERRRRQGREASAPRQPSIPII